MRLLAAGLALLLVADAAFAQLVLNAQPTVKVESGEDATERVFVAEPEKYRVVITKRDGQHFWASREDRVLVHSVSGAFHNFIPPGGAGYIKVFDTHMLPESMRDPGPRFRYMEHLNLWRGTITYWGVSDNLNLDAGGPTRKR
jgi:hypothetical protein